MFVRDDEDAEEVGEGMRAALYAEEAGKQVGGWAATMLVGCRMVHKDMRVEIEVEAIVSEE